MNQINLIKKSEDVFIVLINNPIRFNLTHRYQVYVKSKGKTVPLLRKRGEKGIKYQINYLPNRNLPECHFAIKTKNKKPEKLLKETITKINPNAKIYYLDGW